MEFRALKPYEIECRVQQVTAKGVMLLLYKDARCDMAILDECAGVLRWKRTHRVINEKEFCAVSIYDKDNEQWVSKEDCGTESNTEKEKGQSSDAFKRACFNWGIGRELYTKIFIFISVPTVQNKNMKYDMKNKSAKFEVSKIETDNTAKKILHLEISSNGKIVFEWDNKNPPTQVDEDETVEEPTLYSCQKCGAQITNTVDRKGKEFTAKEMYTNYGSMCLKCYKEQMKETANAG